MIPVSRCICGQIVHPGTVLESIENPSVKGIVEQVTGPIKAVTIETFTVVMLSDGEAEGTNRRFRHHRGDRIAWQRGVGKAVECKTAADIPPPCGCKSPACQSKAKHYAFLKNGLDLKRRGS